MTAMHDMSFFDRSVPPDVGKKQRDMFGTNMFERAENTVKYLKSLGINITHTILPNIAHNQNEAEEIKEHNPNFQEAKGPDIVSITSEFFNKILENFRNNNPMEK